MREICFIAAVFGGCLTIAASAAAEGSACARSRDLHRLVKSGVETSGSLRLEPMVCADVPGGVRCATLAGAPLVEIDAAVLGRSTPLAAAERLSQCKSLNAPSGCVFSVGVTPTYVAVEGHTAAQIIRIVSQGVDVSISPCAAP